MCGGGGKGGGGGGEVAREGRRGTDRGQFLFNKGSNVTVCSLISSLRLTFLFCECMGTFLSFLFFFFIFFPFPFFLSLTDWFINKNRPRAAQCVRLLPNI